MKQVTVAAIMKKMEGKLESIPDERRTARFRVLSGTLRDLVAMASCLESSSQNFDYYTTFLEKKVHQ